MVTVLALLGVLTVLFVAAVVATRSGPVLRDAPPDSAATDLPRGPLQPEDVSSVRFDLALRGYRMSEVDVLLERLTVDLRVRDERIAALEREGRPAEPIEPPAADPAAPPPTEPAPPPSEPAPPPPPEPAPPPPALPAALPRSPDDQRDSQAASPP